MKIKAIIVGNLLDIIGTNVATVAVALAMKFFGKIFESQLSGAMFESFNEPFRHKFIFQAVGVGCSILGGYVAAKIAKEKELLYGASSAIICTSLGVYA